MQGASLRALRKNGIPKLKTGAEIGKRLYFKPF
jgi:hypothetical protein